jgi:hypothetical protein
MTRCARLVTCLATLVLPFGCGGLMAAESTLSAEAQQQVAELEAMITSRDTEEYEVAFEPIALDRVLIKDRLGREHLYHYLAFRVRNEISESQEEMLARTVRYNEILQQMATEYEYAQINEGVELDVHGEKVLDRADKRAKERHLAISVLAYDENGSAIDLLDEPIGSGDQKELNIPDYGDYTANTPLDLIRDKAEEQLGRKLLTLEEIRAKALPPFDPSQTDDETVSAVGEVYGVVIFNRLNDHGDHFTIEMRGLSSKLRVRLPEAEAGQVENYSNTRVLRRVYTLEYSRPGDEYYRDLDKFVLGTHGWRWLDTFQRLQTRSDMAYVRYFFANLEDKDGHRVPATEERFWAYYQKVLDGHPDADPKALPDLEKGLQDR